MTAIFQFKSLEEIAALMRQKAVMLDEKLTRAQTHGTRLSHKERLALEVEKSTWLQAAELLKQSTIGEG